MQNSVWDEHELVRRCKEGSEAAYAELVRQHGGRLVTLAYRLTGSRETAEDVAQETFLAAFRAMERFEPRPALAPWLTTIAVRFASKAATRPARPASLDQLTGSDSSDDGPAFQVVSTAPDPHAAAEASEIRAEVQRALDLLPFRHRSAVVLRLVIGMDYADAARAMDVPLNTYKSLLLRGTRQLREILAPLLPEAPQHATVLMADAATVVPAAAPVSAVATVPIAADPVASRRGNGKSPRPLVETEHAAIEIAAKPEQ